MTSEIDKVISYQRKLEGLHTKRKLTDFVEFARVLLNLFQVEFVALCWQTDECENWYYQAVSVLNVEVKSEIFTVICLTPKLQFLHQESLVKIKTKLQHFNHMSAHCHLQPQHQRTVQTLKSCLGVTFTASRPGTKR